MGGGKKKKNDYIRDGEWCGAVILEICKTGLDKHTTDDLPQGQQGEARNFSAYFSTALLTLYS